MAAVKFGRRSGIGPPVRGCGGFRYETSASRAKFQFPQPFSATPPPTGIHAKARERPGVPEKISYYLKAKAIAMRDVIRWADDWPKFASYIKQRNPDPPSHYIPTRPYKTQMSFTLRKAKQQKKEPESNGDTE